MKPQKKKWKAKLAWLLLPIRNHRKGHPPGPVRGYHPPVRMPVKYAKRIAESCDKAVVITGWWLDDARDRTGYPSER